MSILMRVGEYVALALLMTGLASAQQVAFTWDDLPAHSALPPGETRVGIGLKLIAAMKAEHLPPVYGFVNGTQTVQEPASGPMLKDWRKAGFLLGNHTWSHEDLGKVSLEDWEANVIKNEPLLKSLMGDADWRWLRYPYLSEGGTAAKRDGARAFLKSRGYKVAGVTMSFGDYAYNDPYARCVVKGDAASIAALETDYLAAAEHSMAMSRGTAQAVYGRDIPYVLLMHVGAFDARMLPRLLELYRAKGFSFVSLEEAERDPFYANDLDLTLPSEPDTLEGAARVKGVSVSVPARVNSLQLEGVCR